MDALPGSAAPRDEPRLAVPGDRGAGFGPAFHLSVEIDRLVAGGGVLVFVDDAPDRWRAAVAGLRG
jgi:hypothetical protein